MDGRSYARSAIESDAINSLAKAKRNPRAYGASFFLTHSKALLKLKIPGLL
jgi:hypothetical protein